MNVGVSGETSKELPALPHAPRQFKGSVYSIAISFTKGVLLCQGIKSYAGVLGVATHLQGGSSERIHLHCTSAVSPSIIKLYPNFCRIKLLARRRLGPTQYEHERAHSSRHHRDRERRTAVYCLRFLPAPVYSAARGRNRTHPERPAKSRIFCMRHMLTVSADEPPSSVRVRWTLTKSVKAPNTKHTKH